MSQEEEKNESNNNPEFEANISTEVNNSTSLNPNKKQDEEDFIDRTHSDIELSTVTYNLKIVFVGDSNVGKTSIIIRYCENIFDETAISATISVAFKNKKMKIDPFTIVSMNIWDTAGQEKYRSMTRGYLRDSHGVFLVFDLSNKKSFDSLNSWLEEINNSDINKKCVKILIGNKSDCNEKEIEEETAKKFAEEKGMKYYTVSAKEGVNIETMFEKMGNDCVKILIQEEEENNKSNVNKGNGSKSQKKNSVILVQSLKKDSKKEEKKYSCC